MRKNEHWYDGITYVTELGISNGTGNNCFSPDAPITVRQWSVMLCRAYDQAEALEKDKAEFGTYCSTQAYWNGWIPMEAVTAPDTQMCRGALYQSAFSVIDLPIYNYELYPDGVFLHSHENSVRVAPELGICEAGTSASEIATRGEAADLLYKIMTQEYEVIEPPAKMLFRRFESGPYLHLVPSSNWLGRQPLKLEIAGSSPAGITIRGYSSTGRAVVSKTTG